MIQEWFDSPNRWLFVTVNLKAKFCKTFIQSVKVIIEISGSLVYSE